MAEAEKGLAIERVFSGDLVLLAGQIDQHAKQVTWIIEQKS